MPGRGPTATLSLRTPAKEEIDAIYRLKVVTFRFMPRGSVQLQPQSRLGVWQACYGSDYWLVDEHGFIGYNDQKTENSRWAKWRGFQWHVYQLIN